MQEERQLKTEAFTKSVYYLNYAKSYLDEYRRGSFGNEKYIAGKWQDKVTNLLSDIYCSLNDASRERFMDEIAANLDPIFMEAISGKIIQLSPDQRELVETLVDGLLKGETVTFEKIPEPQN